MSSISHVVAECSRHEYWMNADALSHIGNSWPALTTCLTRSQQAKQHPSKKTKQMYSESISQCAPIVHISQRAAQYSPYPTPSGPQAVAELCGLSRLTCSHVFPIWSIVQSIKSHASVCGRTHLSSLLFTPGCSTTHHFHSLCCCTYQRPKKFYKPLFRPIA